VSNPKDVVRGFFAVFSAGNVDRILECLTEDATWWVAGSIPHMSGESSRSELGNVLRHAFTLYKDRALRITPSSMIAEGNAVAVEADGYAEMNDGRIYRNQYHFLVHVNGNQIQRVKEYSDTQHMYATFAPYLSV
jgi:ketosteroid isomerase-like protein